MIDLYTAATPKGHKVSIVLEELGPPHTVHARSFDLKENTYLKTVRRELPMPNRINDARAVKGAQAMLIR